MGKKRKVEVRTIKDSREYVLWSRVSTKDQGADGLGIAAQGTIARTFMGREPIQTFTDVYSGTKLRQCKNLWEAINLCNEKGYLLVVAHYDRFRNVQQALEILDAVGERNLIICNLPSTDRFVLTIMFAVAENQALIGRIKTKVALDERKRQIKEEGGFFSKSGNWCTHLGQRKGADLSKARAASSIVLSGQSKEWRDSSPLYSWVTIQYYKRRPRKGILEEAAALYEKNPDKYCTREGCPLSKGVLSKWIKELQMQ